MRERTQILEDQVVRFDGVVNFIQAQRCRGNQIKFRPPIRKQNDQSINLRRENGSERFKIRIGFVSATRLVPSRRTQSLPRI